MKKSIKLRRDTFTYYKLYNINNELDLHILNLYDTILYDIDLVFLEYISKNIEYSNLLNRSNWSLMTYDNSPLFDLMSRFMYCYKNIVGSTKGLDESGLPYTRYRQCDLDNEYIDRYDCICCDEPCTECLYKEEEESFQSLQYKDNRLYIINSILYDGSLDSLGLFQIVFKESVKGLIELTRTKLHLPYELFEIICYYLIPCIMGV